jgi:tetratricopeptide (TPR) repeat protein
MEHKKFLFYRSLFLVEMLGKMFSISYIQFSNQSERKNLRAEIKNNYMRFFLSIIFTLSIGSLQSQQIIIDQPGKFRKTSHGYSQTTYSRAAYNTTHAVLEKIVDAFRKVYPDPRGADVGPYGGLDTDGEFPGAPFTSTLRIPFYDYYMEPNGSVEAGGEYASSLIIRLNNIHYILKVKSVSNCYDKIYRAPEEASPFLGFKRFNRMILIQPPGRELPWRPATKEEYLQEVISGLQSGLKNYPSKAEVINYVRGLLSSLNEEEKKQTAWIYKQGNSGYNFDKQGRTIELGFDTKWKGFAQPGNSEADQLVMINDKYYDGKLPKNSLQVMTIEASYYDLVGQHVVRRERINKILRAPGLLTDLQDLLNKPFGNLIATNKQEIKSNNDHQQTKQKFEPIKPINLLPDSTYNSFINFPYGGGGSSQLPAPDPGKLSLAKRKLETKEQLVQYLDELNLTFMQSFPGLSIAETDDLTALNNASVLQWLDGTPEQAAILAIHAAQKDPDNSTLLNNLSSTLTLCGTGFLGIPVEEVVQKKEPDNSTVNNNLGQAWVTAGDMEKAKTYLQRAIAKNPYHPHANSTMGYILLKRGDKNGAAKYFENSVRGQFTISAYNGLLKTRKYTEIKLMNYIRHRYRQPDYINFNKYLLPRQCLKVEESETRIEEHRAFQSMIDKELEKYQRSLDEEKILAKAAMMQFRKDFISGKKQLRPFQPFAYYVVGSITDEYTDRIMLLQKQLKPLGISYDSLQKRYEIDIANVEKQFEKRSDAVGEGNGDPELEADICAAKKKVKDFYLEQFAGINEEVYHLIVHANKDYLNDLLFWIRFATIDEHSYKVAYYTICRATLQVLRQVHLTTLLPTCDNELPEKKESETPEMHEPVCPFSIHLPLIVGIIKLDCEEFKLQAGELLLGNIEYKFHSQEWTVAAGIGLQLHVLELHLGPAEVEIGAEAKQQLFITFGNKSPTDIGMRWEAEMEMKLLGPLHATNKGGWALTMNNGIVFTPPLQVIDSSPEAKEVPLNKHVKIYREK